MQALTACVTACNKKPITFSKATEAWENLDILELQEWEDKYEGIDIREELLKMTDWILTCTDKKLTNTRDWRRFITVWLGRAESGKVKSNAKKSN